MYARRVFAPKGVWSAMTLIWSAETCTAEMAVKSKSRSKSRSNPGLPATSLCKARISSPSRGPLATASTRRREASIRNDRGTSRAYALHRGLATSCYRSSVSLSRSAVLELGSSATLGDSHRRLRRAGCYQNATAPPFLRRRVDSPHEVCRRPRSYSPSSRPSSRITLSGKGGFFNSAAEGRTYAGRVTVAYTPNLVGLLQPDVGRFEKTSSFPVSSPGG